MGSRGPLPKDPGSRRRRNPNAPAVVEFSGPGRKPPPLPTTVKVPATVRAWWRTLWASPISQGFDVVDHAALTRIVVLWVRALDGRATVGELAELRQLEDRFGLNPLARRRLGWQVLSPQGASADEDAPQPPPPSARGRLRAV
jgi:hypothetical protein